MRNLHMPMRHMNSTRVCQLHSAARFMSLSHFLGFSFSTIVRETVAGFPTLFGEVSPHPRPGGHKAAESFAFSTFCSAIFSINIFLSVSCAIAILLLLVAIFHFLLHTFLYAYLLLGSGHLKCNSLRNIPFKSIKIRNDGGYDGVPEYFSSSIFVCSVWVFISPSSGPAAAHAVPSVGSAMGTVNTRRTKFVFKLK